MTTHRPTADRIPSIVRTWMAPFARHFTAPVWNHVLVLLTGAVLCPGKRTVAAALRIMGLETASNFTVYHQVLNRARWSGRALARHLLDLIVSAFVGDGPVIIGLDDTIERRWGPKIAARGIYREGGSQVSPPLLPYRRFASVAFGTGSKPVRSSKEHFVKTSGLRWLGFMVLTPIPWAARVWTLPFLTILAPSERYHADRGRRHKSLTDWARQGALCVCRWLPDRRLVFAGDSSFAAIGFVAAVARRATAISRLRLDANLFAPAPERAPHRPGRPAVRGKAMPKLKAMLTDPVTAWRSVLVTGWYGDQTRRLDIATGVAVWYRGGVPPVTLRWVLVRDTDRPDDPQAFFSTDTGMAPETILTFSVRRLAVEVTFQECRAHLGVETQRQWSDPAILRTTPALLGMFSLIALWTTDLITTETAPRQAAWYRKSRLTVSDAMAFARCRLWLPDDFFHLNPRCDHGKTPAGPRQAHGPSPPVRRLNGQSRAWLGVALQAGRHLGRMDPAGGMGAVGGQGDQQNLADSGRLNRQTT